MSDYVILSYRRVGADRSTGSILYWSEEDQEDAKVLESFEGVTFKELLSKFAKYMQVNSSASGVFHRADRPGIPPVKLVDAEADLFRTDPAQAIQHYLIPPQVVHVGVKKPYEEKSETMVPPLVVGYDMRADFFGELVFIKVREKKVECPSCGKWCGPVHAAGDEASCSCGLVTRIEDLQPKWAGVSTKSLVASGVERFFLPRKWNENGNWISRAELQKKLSDYLEEKEKVSCTRS